MNEVNKVFVIAGEASGDALGGGLLKALRAQNPNIEFKGVGGKQMQSAGLTSLLPMEELCVMGLVEVVEHLPRLLKLMDAMVEEIEAFNPDVLLTIDLPDFNFRVAEKLKKRGKCNAKTIHYVAPTVWAWREGRAKKISKYIDGLLCLFPFEPDYFTPHGIRAEFIGHPLTEKTYSIEDGVAFRQQNDIAADVPLLTLMFGSRKRELESHGQIFLDAIEILLEQMPNIHFVVPTLPHMEYEVRELLSTLEAPAYVMLGEQDKWNAVAASDAAMAVSGTVALELAYAGTPHVIAYKANPITGMLVRQMAKVEFAHLANIMLNRAAVPEFLQGKCTAENLAGEVLKLFQDSDTILAQQNAFQEIQILMKPDAHASASDKAAQFVLSLQK